MIRVVFCLLGLVLCLPVPGMGQNSIELLPGMRMPTEDDILTYGCVLQRSYSADKFPQVPGPETTIKVYRCLSKQVAIYQFMNLNIYAVATKDGMDPAEGCIDEDSLGYCTRIVQEDEEFSVDFKTYDVKTRKFEAYRTDVVNLPQAEGLKIPRQPDDFLVGEPEEEPR